eukprot:gene26906-4522_t
MAASCPKSPLACQTWIKQLSDGGDGDAETGADEVQWRVSNSNGSISLPTRVPGYVMETLEQAGIIGNPLSSNNIQIVVHNAVEWAKEQYEQYPYEIPTNQAPGAFLHYPFIRKPASDFGWDWGPAFAPAGIPGAVYMLSIDTPLLKDVFIRQHHQPLGSVTLTIECEIWVPNPQDGKTAWAGILTAHIPELDVLHCQEVQVPAMMPMAEAKYDHPLQRFVKLEVHIRHPVKLWWPVGFGEQPLFNITVRFTPMDETARNHKSPHPSSVLTPVEGSLDQKRSLCYATMPLSLPLVRFCLPQWIDAYASQSV